MERNSLRNWWTCDPCGVAWRGDALSECPTCNKHGVKGISMCNRCGEHAPDGGLCSDCTIAASEPRTIPFAPNESKPLKCDWVPWAQKMADKLVEDEAERYTAQTLDAQDWYTRKEPQSREVICAWFGPMAYASRALKYMFRAGHKSGEPGHKDLRKAANILLYAAEYWEQQHGLVDK